MGCKLWFVLMLTQLLFCFQLAYADDKNESYRIASTFILVSTEDAENPDQFIKKIKKNLIAILDKEKILQAGYPKPCQLKEQADRSQICVAEQSLSLLADSTELLLSNEGWTLRFRMIKFPSPMSFEKQIYLLPEGFKSKLKFMLSGMKNHRDSDFAQIQLIGGLPSREFDEILDQAIVETGAVVD
jgi:hypothetical protein